MKMWRADRDALKPVEVDCPDGLWPERDADGVQIFDNSHFETAAEARDSLCRNIEARIDSAGSNVTNARNHLRVAEARAARMAEEFARFRELNL